VVTQPMRANRHGVAMDLTCSSCAIESKARPLVAAGGPGPRKDTAIVLPTQKVSVTLVADHPGIWMMHCHNTYHQEAGMVTSLNYAT
jgi:FtsP/CotA-like multicopper oxidase with cupredoxin domain